ncbi:hypothetical protein OF001_U30279 [Pseudomonas sp. OF001]|uniref:hypothetical protein n=1 Tax=Pseudomonas sp. OF001 TaxID=2772300 RepID=UPI00191857D6|nr:hypothetical protein [Pseudomonas sp. OF001]CAD5378478.1 hypothetical protein OF001_U30279 [Pseudomonas sp. OF001]
MTKSELFRTAHKLTRETIQAGDNYAVTFAAALRILTNETTVTSVTGKVIKLTNTGTEIVAICGSIRFNAVKTAQGFESRFIVSAGAAGNRRISVALEGAELTKAHKLFAKLEAAIASRREDDARHAARHAQIRRAA